MTDTPAPRRLWPRIVLWIVLILLLVVGAAWGWAWSVRRAGLERNRAVLATLASYGLPTSPSAFIASGPDIDPALQARLKMWMQRCKGAPWAEGLWEMAKGLTGAGRPAPPASAALLTAAAADLDALAAMLATDRLQISAHGWLRTECPNADRASVADLACCTVPDLLSIRAAAAGFAVRALMAEDPRQALVDLDRLCAAIGRPAVLIDAFIAIACHGVRADASLALERSGRLPPSSRAVFLALEPQAMRLVADGSRGDYALLHLPFNRTVVEAGLLPWLVSGEVPDLGPGIRLAATTWTYGPGDMAISLRMVAEIEQACRAGMPPRFDPADLATMEKHRTYMHVIQPTLEDHISFALLADNFHRLRQFAVRLLAISRERGALPADEAAAKALLGAEHFAEGPARCRLRYELLEPRRFRIAFDSAVAPKGWPPARILPVLKVQVPASILDRRSTAPLLNRQGIIEADLIEADLP